MRTPRLFETNLYKLLQVDPEADPEVITAAYKVLLDKLHLARAARGVTEFREAELKRAYAVLSDPGKRNAYDAEHAPVAFSIGPADGPESAPIPVGGLSGRIAAQDGGTAAQAHDDGPPAVRLNFGRYAGHSLEEILHLDGEYLRWLSRHSSGLRYRNAIMKLLAQPEAPRTPVKVKP